MNDSKVVTSSRIEIQNSPENPVDNLSMKGGLVAMVEEFLNAYFSAHEGMLPANGLHNLILQEVERPLLRITLKSVKGNQKRLP